MWAATRKTALNTGVNSMSKLTTIIRMEFRLTVANKVFVILTVLGPFLIAAIALLPGLLSGSEGASGSPVTRIAIVGADTAFITAISPALQQSRIDLETVHESIAAMDSQVLGGLYDGYLVLPADVSGVLPLQYVSRDATDFRVIGVLHAVIGQAVVARRLVQAGVSASQTASLVQPPGLETRQLTHNGEKKKNSDYVTVLMTGLMFAVMLYMTLILYGQVIGRSVLTEKTSKTVEIMLSSVRSIDLLFGKILGKALASLLQYGIWVGIAAAILKIVGPGLGITVGAGLTMSTLACLVLFFILAFFLYCSLYAALGAASEDEQHLGQLAWPVVIFLIIPVMMISPIITTPQAPVIVGLSLFPLTAPIVMFLRILVGAARTWQVLLSVGLILLTTAGVIWLSARIFQAGILLTGKRFNIVEVLRLSRNR